MAKTVQYMVVHHPRGLHVRVDDGRTHKTESPPLQILADGVRKRRPRRIILQGPPPVDHGPAVDKPPEPAHPTLRRDRPRNPALTDPPMDSAQVVGSSSGAGHHARSPTDAQRPIPRAEVGSVLIVGLVPKQPGSEVCAQTLRRASPEHPGPRSVGFSAKTGPLSGSARA